MDLSVVICTYNRSYNLPRCLEGLARQQDAAQISWEVVLVDNNSRDNTARVAKRLAKRLPLDLNYVFEGEQGLSAARNRGVRQARGRFLIFIDDDILVSSRWLRSAWDAFRSSGADAVGGRIHLDPGVPLPRWIDRELRGFLGHQDYGESPLFLDGITRYPFGGNMAVTRQAFHRVGGFDTSYGRKGEGKKAGELFKGMETNFFRRLAGLGGKIFYEPAMVVYHRVEPHQLRRSYFRKIHFNAGYQKGYLDGLPAGRRLAGVPLYLLPQTARACLKLLEAALRLDPAGTLRRQMILGHFLGQIAGSMNRHRKMRGDRGA
ncbi:Glycosyltransferase, GT2 family [Desulfacinum hydrothermale DSM 13146]|uniref:Glycosyltransferase, GT2 family n=1 Tax=Desulfacinum hydrothermale DSM 13146 TaxID=1121390 RepID=A0A1W1XQQ8_9BACT|nr:glycosyltransferase [Desulfacinum hydrothermale]SMC26320.1 Glycosyltransferase, GT2 family [Desulfacinum hydrothermale DSM 13146]